MSTLTDNLASLADCSERRFYPRIEPRTLTEISFGPEAPGILLNLSENGLLVSTAAALDLNSVHRVALSLPGVPRPVVLYLRAVWSTPDWQKSGLQLLNLGDTERALIRSWAKLQASSELPIDSEQAAHVASTAIPEQPEERVQSLSQEHAETAATKPTEISEPPPGVAIADPPPPIVYAPLSKPATNQQLPMHHFWISAAATILLGATAAAVYFVLPDKTPTSQGAARTHVRHTAQPVGSAATETVPPTPTKPTASPAAPVLPTPKLSSPPQAAPTNSAQKLPPPMLSAAPRPSMVQAPAKSQSMSSQLPAPSTTSAKSGAQFYAANAAPSDAEDPTQPRPVLSRDSAIARSTLADRAPTTAYAPNANSTVPTVNPRATASTLNPAASSDHSENLVRRPIPDRPAQHVASLAPSHSMVTLEVPSMSSAAYVRVPGEHVVRGSAVTMHIQRSVWLKGDHWLWSSRRKVELGEIASRVDPQLPRYVASDGSISVVALVERNGQISSVRLVSGSPQLLSSVARALREWRYQPTYVDQKPAETLVRIEVDFHAPDHTYSR